MSFSPSEKTRLIGRVNTLEKATELLEMRVDKHAAALVKMTEIIDDLVAEKKACKAKKAAKE